MLLLLLLLLLLSSSLLFVVAVAEKSKNIHSLSYFKFIIINVVFIYKQ
jgi:hypothetical protein